jgi:thiamine-phosphate pyrophosphorylase
MPPITSSSRVCSGQSEMTLNVLASAASTNAALLVESVAKPYIHGLYAITPELHDDALLINLVEQALSGGVRLLQYRHKNLPPSQVMHQALAIQALCRQAGAIYIVNDSAAFAAQIGASACHLGQADGTLAEARAALPQGIIGVSCYNDIARAHKLASQGASYLAFGAAFPSTVKPHAPHAALSVFREARAAFTHPIVAIGGITLANAPALIDAGVDAIAVISDLFSAANIEARALAFSNLFN